LTVAPIPAPSVSLVVAVADNGVIGQHNRLPWRLSDDLKRFKALTLGKPVIMGRKTWESIGRPLPGRRNLVVSRQPQLHLEGAEVVASLSAAVQCCQDAAEVMVIGGAEIYRQAMPMALRLYLTRVHAQIEGDAFFELPQADAWHELAREDHSADERNQFAYSFCIYQRS